MNTLKALSCVLVCASTACQGTGDAGWIPLFDGTTLDGWHASEHPASFTVRDGMIVANGERSHLFYEGPVANHDFQNFEFKTDVMALPNSNSGIYFHTQYQDEGWPSLGYEVQVCNTDPDDGGYREIKRTGSLYGIRNVYTSPVENNDWCTMRVKVEGRRVQIFVNDVQTVDYIEPDQPPAGIGMEGRRLTRGTFALQGHDPGSTVHFRNIYVRPLPDAPLPPDNRPPDTIAFQERMTRYTTSNIPLIDYHAHLKGGLTIEQLLEHARSTGITYGVAVNCGLGFPVESDEKALAFFDSLKGKPVFRAMQAEGREWRTMFSQNVIDSFDYVFTDAMTFHDRQGRRTRLWMKDEVWVDDPQDFMEMYVARIEKILREEPIDIYVNATFLPDVLRDRYDALWTNARMDRVIKGLVDSGIAMEINARYKIPSMAFIQRAKDAGVKFTFGTNNGDANLGALEYCLEVVDSLGLQRKDLWYPEE